MAARSALMGEYSTWDNLNGVVVDQWRVAARGRAERMPDCGAALIDRGRWA